MSMTAYHPPCLNPDCGYCNRRAALDPMRRIREVMRATRPKPAPKPKAQVNESEATNAD